MKEVEENFRVQKIQGLKNLAVFSDEAHHVYGNIGDKIKRTRDVLNNISSEGDIKCVINTTGTPYNGKNMLQETIFWYGLTKGIEDKILKNIEVVDYNLSREDEASVVNNVMKDFFQTYKHTKTKDGAMAKIAFYFKDEKHLQENKIYIQNALMEIKEDLNTVLVNTQQSSKEELIEFANINNPASTKRVLLLIKKAMEGFDCPSLFATAVIRVDSSSSNFILQSSTRCLRNIDGENITAKIYLSTSTREILDKELQANFGITIRDLGNAKPATVQREIVVKNQNIAPIKITTKIETFRQARLNVDDIKFETFNMLDRTVEKMTHDIDLQNGGIGYAKTHKEIEVVNRHGIINVAHRFATKYNIDYFKIYDKLKNAFNEGFIQSYHIKELEKQIEKLLITTSGEEREEVLTKYFIRKEGFQINANGELFAVVNVRADKQYLLTKEGIDWHYTPYIFDSEPEKEFLDKILARLTDPQTKEDIENIYFTGGLTHPSQTDIWFDWNDNGNMRKYYPDFIIRKKNGDYVVIEIKSNEYKQNEKVRAKKKAVQQFENKNGSQMIKYEIIYVEKDKVEDTRITNIIDLLK
jgi:hypothetical protein